MATSSRVHTLHDNRNSDVSEKTEGVNEPADTGAGFRVDDFQLPPAQTPPPEPPKPSSNEEWKREHPDPSKEDIALRQKEWDTRQIWLNYTKERDEVEKNGSKPFNAKDTIFDNNDYLNQDEAVVDWVDEMALVMRTEADMRKRSAAHTYLLRHLSDGRNSDIKDTCLHNRGRLEKWARGGYKGEQPKTQYASKNEKNEIIKNKEGETIYTDTPSKKPDNWNEVRRRTDAPPEEDPPEYPSEEYMSRIVGLWETGTRELQKILETPEEIRGEPGKELLKINAEIEDVKNEYVRGLGPSDKSKAGGIPQLAIPTGMIVVLLVECTERTIQNGTSTDDKEVSDALNLIKQYVSRANQGEMWIENMEKAFNYHIEKAQQLYNSGADNIQKIHDSDEFWNTDLADWIRNEYMASAQSTNAGPEWRSQEEHSQPDPDRMSVSSDQHANARDSEILTMNNAGSPTANTTAAWQNNANAAQSQPLEDFANVSGSSLSTADDYALMYHGVERTVGGYRHRGIVKGGGHGFSVLLLMKGDNFYHMIASSEVDASDSEPLDYLAKGGHLIGDVKDPNKRLKIGNNIEGRDHNVEGQKFKDFIMSAYAVTPRSQDSNSERCVNQYIRGHFNGANHAGETRWYSKGGFCELGRFRPGPVQVMIDNFKAKHSITPEDEAKLKTETRKKATYWGKREETSRNDQGFNHVKSGFVVTPNNGDRQPLRNNPDSTNSSSASKPNRGDGSQRGDYFNAAFTVPKSDIRLTPTGPNQQTEDSNERIRSLETTVQRMGDMLTAMMAKLGVQDVR